MEDYIDIRGYESKPLTWWKEVGEARYPTLARVAYDLFAVPGMSNPAFYLADSIFSQLGNLLEQRMALIEKRTSTTIAYRARQAC